MAAKLLRERTRTNVLRHLPTRHFDLPVHEAAWHVGFDGGFAERPPRLSASAVWAVEDLTAGGIGLDDGAPRDPPHLLCEERIVRDERLHLLRQAVSVVKPICIRQPDDFGQRVHASPSEPSRCASSTTP